MDSENRFEPFFKAPKAPLKAILERVDGTDAAFAIAVFVALRWLP